MPDEVIPESERWGVTRERMKNMAEDIGDLKKSQVRQEKVLVEQGKEITKLKTQIALAGAFGGMTGSLIVGLILLFAQKGSP